MIEAVRKLGNRSLTVAILSDQTDWLDRLDEQHRFYHLFDRIFNSFYLGKTKRDLSIFTETMVSLGARPETTLFVDDNQGHIDRAARLGLRTFLFTDQETFLDNISSLCPS
jgi:putative hydrolase of the HAD superfamily